MKILADTNLFIKFCRRLPLPATVETALLNPTTERYLSPASVMELFRLWQKRNLPDNPDTWLDLALLSWNVLPITVPIARQSILWPWEHRDPADRLLAGNGGHSRVGIVAHRYRLKKLTGFPARYFANLENPPVQRPV